MQIKEQLDAILKDGGLNPQERALWAESLNYLDGREVPAFIEAMRSLPTKELQILTQIMAAKIEALRNGDQSTYEALLGDEKKLFEKYVG